MNNRSQTSSSVKFTLVLDLKIPKNGSSPAKGRKSGRKDVTELPVNRADPSVGKTKTTEGTSPIVEEPPTDKKSTNDEPVINDDEPLINDQCLIDEEDEQIVGIKCAGNRPVKKKIDSANLGESHIRISKEPNAIDDRNGLTSVLKAFKTRLMLENSDSCSNYSFDFSNTEDETESDEEEEVKEKRNDPASGSSVEEEPSYLKEELFHWGYLILTWIICGVLAYCWETFCV